MGDSKTTWVDDGKGTRPGQEHVWTQQMADEERDPLTNPAAGDWLTGGTSQEVRVDRVTATHVYFARFRSGEEEAIGLVKMSLDDWRACCRAEGARVRQMPGGAR